MTVVQPAAVAMRAAVSLVTIPPVPHWLSPLPAVSTCTTQVSSRGGWGWYVWGGVFVRCEKGGLIVR